MQEIIEQTKRYQAIKNEAKAIENEFRTIPRDTKLKIAESFIEGVFVAHPNLHLVVLQGTSPYMDGEYVHHTQENIFTTDRGANVDLIDYVDGVEELEISFKLSESGDSHINDNLTTEEVEAIDSAFNALADSFELMFGTGWRLTCTRTGTGATVVHEDYYDY